jgi:hypothetical protein
MDRGPQFLYHGTDEDLEEGSLIEPTLQGSDPGAFEGQTVAFADDTPEEAAKYGKNVYKVLKDKHAQEYLGGTWYSEKGFRVVKRHG